MTITITALNGHPMAARDLRVIRAFAGRLAAATSALAAAAGHRGPGGLPSKKEGGNTFRHSPPRPPPPPLRRHHADPALSDTAALATGTARLQLRQGAAGLS